MKKMLSLAVMFAALSYATPASAELKIGGDASLRMRNEFNAVDPGTNSNDNTMWQSRVRLNASADLGSGYFFKTLIMSEGGAGGWVTSTGNENYALAASQMYFGRNMEDCNYVIGRIPLNSFNNPIFDLALLPSMPVDNPISNNNFDRLYGANYGTKVGSGMLNTTLVVLDNSSTTAGVADYDGMLNDGYGLSVAYTTTWGDVTVEPQVFAVITNAQTNLGNNLSPITFGLNASGKVGDGKLSGAAFYTTASDEADYSGYLIRVKGETGPYMAWVDYNKTDDNNGLEYTNTFVWAQYKYTAYKGAAGSLTLQPTLRYRVSKQDGTGAAADVSVLRGEFSATVAF